VLLAEPGVAHALARSARDLVEQRCTWRAAARRYEALYARLAGAVPVELAA
jgi:hypothetical protein